MFFNVLPTIIGSVQDIFLFGVNTRFSPERTHIRSGTTRIALAFRIRRALTLAVRSILLNDVPLGLFWFGWGETPWTPSGFEGWTSGKKPRAILPPLMRRNAPAEAASASTPIPAAEPANAVADLASIVAETAPVSRRPSLVPPLSVRTPSPVLSLVPSAPEEEQDSSEVARRDAA
jgi:hypothetical protein